MVRRDPDHSAANESKGSPDGRLRLFLACILLGAYLLVYVPAPVSADGKAILAVGATLVQHGRLDMDVIGASDSLLPPFARLGAIGVDGALYAKKGPAPSLAVVPLITLARAVPWLPVRATAMLLNPLVTVAVALLLYTLVRWLGFRPRTALIVSLLYGLATMAIVYVKTLFGEPLTALAVLASVAAAIRYQEQRTDVWPLAAGAALAVAVGTNTLYVVLVPIIAGCLLADRVNPLAPRRAALLFALPLILAGAGLLIYNAARFGSPLVSGYHFDQGEGFSEPLLPGVWGLLFGMFRGLFPYNPLLLLAIPGWLMLRRRAPRLAWTALALSAAQVIGFASWWSWHGGIVWGPRFMLPVVPLAALCLTPLVEAAWTRRLLWLPIGMLAMLSSGVQALGALYSYFPYIEYLFAHHGWLSDPVLYDPALSPLIGHLVLVSVGWPLEPAWAARGVDGVYLLVAGIMLITGFAALRWRLARAAAACAVLAGLNLVIARQSEMPEMLRARALEEALDPQAVALAATTILDTALLDVNTGTRFISMNAPTSPEDPRARQVWEHALRQGGERLWLITWFGPADPLNWQERALWEQAAFIREVSAADHRALLFSLDPGPEPVAPGGWRFGPLALEAYAIRQDASALYVTLRWVASEPPDHDYAWFVHVLDAAGNIVAQQDRPPLGGYAPTSNWSPSAPVIDRLCFLLSPDVAPASGWRLRIGIVNVVTGEPLPARTPAGEALPEPFIVLGVGADAE